MKVPQRWWWLSWHSATVATEVASQGRATGMVLGIVRLIGFPDPEGPAGSSRIWINPDHITTVGAQIDRSGTEPRLFVELKLQGLNLNRYWLATGTVDELDEVLKGFLESLRD